MPKHNFIRHDRAVAHLRAGHYRNALDDFDAAIWLDPAYYKSYLGRAEVYEALGDHEAARRDYARSCRLGAREACNRP